MAELRVSLTALGAAQTPRRVSALARAIAWLFVLIPLSMLVAPWQQNISGFGRVAAFAPIERQQVLEAPVSGRVVHWHAREGAKVKAGEALVEIADIDQELLDRLTRQWEAAAAKVAAKEKDLRDGKAKVALVETEPKSTVK